MIKTRFFILLILVFIVGCTANDNKTVDKICGKVEPESQISKCGEHFSSTPPINIADAPAIIYDSEANQLSFCGGYTVFINEEAREKNEKLCAEYLKDCKIIKTC